MIFDITDSFFYEFSYRMIFIIVQITIHPFNIRAVLL